MELDPKLTPPYSTSDPTSFAYQTARERWPIIITQAIDDAYRSVGACDDADKREEGKKIVHELGELKYEVQHDRALTPIRDDGQPDVAGYNKELEQLGNITWLKAPWLFTECYLFRRMSTSFTLSTHWKNYDVFARQKIKTFRSSRPAVLELAARYKDLVTQLRSSHQTPHDPEADKLLFSEICEVCLWGNATDLSLLTSLTYEDIQKLQGSEARRAAEQNILVNDLPAVYAHLLAAKTDPTKRDSGRRVDIVLDNAGFELYVDLILAGYLLSAGLATTVVLHPKSIPWFVSDVLPGDFASLLNALADPRGFYEVATDEERLLQQQDKEEGPARLSDTEVGELEFLFAEWSRFHAEGQLVLRPNRVWTGAGSFWRLPGEAGGLVEDLKEGELVVFKGDLNYRKLVGDVAWDPTTPFTEAIGPLGPGSGLNVLALRTCKADVVVGLEAGVDEKLKQMEGGGGDSGARKWAWNGKWAVVSFSKGT
ncbi:hypothetical protein C8A00DRAFT_40123 [Chaetomidium leptoderma]|uniref:Sugar phosphate phosphatase n=1 Tax=Chaetomidium leptoderma TaxID=669021 RepID=A0AAN6VTK7_9PEZI|nr:hypothetical protein C8A00DRAFT_40123 [Chaetomidium leptoderma]